MADAGSPAVDDVTSAVAFNKFEHATVGALYMLFCVVGVTSNFLTALTFYKDTKLLTTSKPWLHILLAVANLLVVAPSPFPASSSFSGRWLYGNTMCQMYAFEGMFIGIVAIGSVIALCIERYVMGNKPNNGCGWFYIWSILMVIGNGFFWGVMPLLGWSRYTVELSGTSCAIDWKNPDESYISYLVTMEIFSFAIPVVAAFVCLYWAHSPATTQPGAGPSGSGQGDTSGQQVAQVDQNMAPLTEGQLHSLCYVFLLLMLIGWGPFAFLCTSTIFNGAQGLSYLASSIPPLSCKLMVSSYPLAYAVVSPRFRHSFTSVFSASDRKQD
ncbi:retinochrome-like isoform X2 [Physella acuta]|uniref:retinochrome-like isoform X2 n=1 Tax=Physella acuta TaxID=109671 RepID=UPI0027DB5B39|nr:retinochrome-like isoform X2 [Physella acuta]